MAFNPDNFAVALDTLGGQALRIHHYKAGADGEAQMEVAGFFKKTGQRGVRVGDVLIVSTGDATLSATFTAINSVGDATVVFEEIAGDPGPEGPMGPQGESIAGPIGPPGHNLEIDAVGALADRDDYDDEAAGFVFLRNDVQPNVFYVKNSGTSGDWGEAQAIIVASKQKDLLLSSDYHLSETVDPSGYAHSVIDTRNVMTRGVTKSTDSFLMASGLGGRIELDKTLDDVSVGTEEVPGTSYAGPILDNIFEFREFETDVDGNVEGEVNLARSTDPRDWLPATVTPANGLVPTGDMQGYAIVIPSDGSSHSRGGTSFGGANVHVPPEPGDEPPTVITTSDIDASYAFMPGDLFSVSPQKGPGIGFVNDLAPLKHASVLGGAGESHVPAMIKTLLNRMVARGGVKVPIIAFGTGQGGHRAAELETYSPAMTASDYPGIPIDPRPGGIYPLLHRTMNWSRKQGLRKPLKPVPGPLILIHGPNDGLNGINGIPNYEEFLLKRHARYNADVRKNFGLSNYSPDLPIILTCDPCPALRLHPTSSTRRYDKRAISPSAVQFSLAMRFPEKFILGPPLYSLPIGQDKTHFTYAGSYMMGEEIGWTVDEALWARPKRFLPRAVARESSTVFYIIFDKPEGDLVFDTTTVMGRTDGTEPYGHVMWDDVSHEKRNISSIELTPVKNVIKVTQATAASTSEEVWLDFAMFNDIGFGGSGPVGGPRGNLRCSTAHASTLPEWTDPATGDPFQAVDLYRWCPPYRIPIPPRNGQITLDGHLS